MSIIFCIYGDIMYEFIVLVNVLVVWLRIWQKYDQKIDEKEIWGRNMQVDFIDKVKFMKMFLCYKKVIRGGDDFNVGDMMVYFVVIY